jgi:hypothetical protein
LQIIDPNDGIAYQGVALVAGTLPVLTRGTSFSPGTIVLFVDSTFGIHLGSRLRTRVAGLQPRLPGRFGVTGPHNLLAH